MTKSSFDKLTLSKNERLGLYFLLLLFVGFIILPYKFSQPETLSSNLYSPINNSTILSDSNFEIANEIHDTLATPKIIKSEDKTTIKLNAFDPNELDEKTAIQLGLSPLVYKRIQNYLNTGARFKKPEQFGKIYGLSMEKYNMLLPYIKIQNEKQIQTKFKSILPVSLNRIEINECTASELLPLPGIGEGLSARIIKYRDLLGGFHKTDQLKEVYGITDSLYLIIKDYILLNKQILKLNLSKMNFTEMQKHPYIGHKMAKLISAYVKLHPQASNQEILSNLPSTSNEINKNLLAYLDPN
ncbi:MAG: helix-hairpin-helix domain-containing protein [Saprospiraceae bacterium]|jgi:DNA uptake protein ComE-like DNA-binding protein